ncbi:HemK2/MTQ2 family protein methyltransferase [Rhodococcus sp. NPDC058521]|uniref:HemK2/MTQ2 family protein methyltransferase n=1 Tax=Rhodococcus sp. NPDC058521 TaxID=3346536 RepID=UPI003662EFE8
MSGLFSGPKATVTKPGSTRSVFRLPGVYPPQEDTWLLADALRREDIAANTRVLDLCTGTGALAVSAAAAGGRVTAVDVSPRATTNARINARIGGHRVRVLRGDLVDPVRGRCFDIIVSNPPYVPADDDVLPTGGIARAWDAGKNGRALLDRVCEHAPELLAPTGVLLLVQSALTGVEKTQSMLEEKGLAVAVAARAEVDFGAVMRSRSALLKARGLIGAGQHTEELVVVRARK